MNPRNKGVCLNCEFIRTSETEEVREGRMGRRTVKLIVRTCAKDDEDINDHVRDNFCPSGLFSPEPAVEPVSSSGPSETPDASARPLTLPKDAAAVPCVPCAKAAARLEAAASLPAVCSNCGGLHADYKCQIPVEFNPKHYHLDSGGTEPCNC